MSQFLLALTALLGFILLAATVVGWKYGSLWLQSQMSGVNVKFLTLIGMSLRQVPPRIVLTAQIMARQAGLRIAQDTRQTTARLEAHVLAGGDVLQVLRAMIAAHSAGIDLEFDRAAAMDLSGRDILDAVRISVFPRVIDCPQHAAHVSKTLSAVAKDGIEIRVSARVTVRTNFDRLIGGATEETIIARVGQGIVSAIGSSDNYAEVLATPDRICKAVLDHGLDASTAFEIVSIDIAALTVGENIGAKLRVEQAASDTRVAQAAAEERLADALAQQREIIALIAANRAVLVLAETHVQFALADALRKGLRTHKSVKKGPLDQGVFPLELARIGAGPAV